MPADPADLGFTPVWFAAGVVTPDSAADFARLAAARPGLRPRFWRWAAVRDFAEEQGPLTPDQCRAVYQLGRDEPDEMLGVAIRCLVLYQSKCPPDVVAAARVDAQPAVRRAAERWRASAD